VNRKAETHSLRLEQLENREVPAVIGALDASFGAGGKLTTTFGGTETGSAVAIQTDGKIVVVGNTSLFHDFAIARYNPDGTLDLDFSGDGKTTVDFGFTADDEQATGVAIQDDGKIVVGGFATIGGDVDFVVARLKTDGTLDGSFSGDGKTSVDFAGGGSNNDSCFGVASQIVFGSRKIVLAGTTDQTGAATGFDFGVARLNEDGTLDATFNSGGAIPGLKSRDFSISTDVGQAVAIDGDNRIVVAGFTGTGTLNNFGVLRLSTNGSEDGTFGPAGLRTANFGGDDRAFAVAIQQDGKIAVAGQGRRRWISAWPASPTLSAWIPPRSAAVVWSTSRSAMWT